MSAEDIRNGLGEMVCVSASVGKSGSKQCTSFLCWNHVAFLVLCIMDKQVTMSLNDLHMLKAADAEAAAAAKAAAAKTKNAAETAAKAKTAAEAAASPDTGSELTR